MKYSQFGPAWRLVCLSSLAVTITSLTAAPSIANISLSESNVRLSIISDVGTTKPNPSSCSEH
jgi:hypothetical protein